MFEKWFEQEAPKLPAPDAIKALLLVIIIDAQEFGECPWCECPIGASNQHYIETCPFRNINTLLNSL